MKSGRATADREDGHRRSARTVPEWITPELIDETVRVWQPYYTHALSEQEAVDILCSVSRMVEILATTAQTPDGTS